MVTIGNPRARRAAPLVLAAGASVLWAATAAAQVASGRVDFGTRQIFGFEERGSSKFLEYRAIPEGFFIRGFNLKLDWTEPGYFVTARGTDFVERDQSIQISAGRRGLYELRLDFDKTPHLFTNTGRSLYTEQSPGVFTFPAAVRSQLRTILNTDVDPGTPGTQRDLVALGALINGLSHLEDVSLLRERGAATFRYTPSPEWDAQVGYTLDQKRGRRPFGATFGFSPNEQLEPIDYRTHEIRANVERSGETWTLGAGYVGLIFRNDVDALVWDNAFREGPDVSGSAARGRIDLYPDNTSHLGTLSAGVVLPLNGRLTSSLSYGVLSQNDDFLPVTINSAITGVPSLPASSANGKFKTLQFNSNLSLKPAPNLGLGARFRYYDRNNETSSLVFNSYVRTDELLSATARRSLPYAYTRQNVSINANWRVARPVSVRGVYEQEKWDREYRETGTTTDNTLGAMVDVNHRSWLFVRASFRRSDREADEYSAHHVADLAFPDGEVGGQLEALRKFDQADRKRNRAELLARITPGDNLIVSASHSLTDDDYDRSEYGLTDLWNRTTAIDVNFSPAPALTLFADFARSIDRMKMRSRQRAPNADDPKDDWESNAREPVNTYGVGLTGEIVAGRVDMDLSYRLSDGEALTRTKTGPSSIATSAEDYPLVINDYQVLDAAVQYRLTGGAALRFEYRFEKYDQADFALELAPFIGFLDPASAGTTWVGVTRPDFRAHVLSVVMTVGF